MLMTVVMMAYMPAVDFADRFRVHLECAALNQPE